MLDLLSIPVWADYRPPAPTVARPGTREKIDVLRARFSRGERLWHADDEDLAENCRRTLLEENAERRTKLIRQIAEVEGRLRILRLCRAIFAPRRRIEELALGVGPSSPPATCHLPPTA